MTSLLYFGVTGLLKGLLKLIETVIVSSREKHKWHSMGTGGQMVREELGVGCGEVEGRVDEIVGLII